MVLDLDMTLAPGTVSEPRRLIAAMLAVAIHDRADHLLLERDPTPGIEGAICQHRVAGKQYDLTPPPLHHLPAIGRALRQLAERVESDVRFEISWLMVRLAGHDFGVDVVLASNGNNERFSFCLPSRPELSRAAYDLLSKCSGASGRIEFDEDEFA